jgi:hypothetical protein
MDSIKLAGYNIDSVKIEGSTDKERIGDGLEKSMSNEKVDFFKNGSTGNQKLAELRADRIAKVVKEINPNVKLDVTATPEQGGEISPGSENDRKKEFQNRNAKVTFYMSKKVIKTRENTDVAPKKVIETVYLKFGKIDKKKHRRPPKSGGAPTGPCGGHGPVDACWK